MHSKHTTMHVAVRISLHWIQLFLKGWRKPAEDRELSVAGRWLSRDDGVRHLQKNLM
jgi:hypothetical protein